MCSLCCLPVQDLRRGFHPGPSASHNTNTLPPRTGYDAEALAGSSDGSRPGVGSPAGGDGFESGGLDLLTASFIRQSMNSSVMI